jgi:hypothetical protein
MKEKHLGLDYGYNSDTKAVDILIVSNDKLSNRSKYLTSKLCHDLNCAVSSPKLLWARIYFSSNAVDIHDYMIKYESYQ